MEFSGRSSRRALLGAGAAALAATPGPASAAVAAAGIKPQDLIVKQVKVYVLSATRGRAQRIASIVTNSGIEGNYTLENRYFHPNWSNLGWLDYAKAAGLPVYRLLGAYRDKVRAYASSQHLKTVDDFVADLQHAKGQGFTAYKIHPPWLENNAVDYRLDIEVAKAIRKAAGDRYPLLFDRVGAYTREEAVKVGRALDELGYISYEDPLPTTDIDGLVELANKLDIPITIGEFIFSPYNFGEYIRSGAVEIVRFIVDNIGGITGGMKIGRLAECFGMECQPHNWGSALDHAVHFHCELAMPNNVWFEMTQPQGITDQPWFKDKIRIDSDGYVPAPVKPGLGYELDRDAMDKMMVRVES